MKLRILIPICLCLYGTKSFAILGSEMVPLMKIVAGQVTEIERLSETLNVARENRELLMQINEGINRTVDQIQSVQSIIDSSQGLDPRAIRSIADLNDYLDRVKEVKLTVDEILAIKNKAAGVAVGQAAVQSDTAFKMGQEMIDTGSLLANESQTASPGRASQITAASSSAQMLASGVALQTLSQITQLQAMQLELQRSQINAIIDDKKASQTFFQSEVIAQNQTQTKHKRQK